MTAANLSAPGSSTYSSDTMTVGDGTWDATLNDFLLPNLQGLNLATTQYNGMGNRFASLLPYHSLIKAHGGIASVVFLFLVPTAILIARFHQSNRRRAIHIHIWIQILVVFLLTVVVILGWFAVGPARSLTNPHHGIGVAIYTLVLVQVLGGAVVRRLERNKSRDYLPVKMMLHHWMGRAIALLGITQVALGLDLYGSAKGTFIAYALVMSAWVLIYFILSHRYQSERFIGTDYGGSHLSRSYVSERSDHRRQDVVIEGDDRRNNFWRNTLLAGGAFAGLRALRDRSKRQREDVSVIEEVDEEVVPSNGHSRRSRRPSGSYIEEEKLVGSRRNHTWRDRIEETAVGFAAFEGVRRLLGRRNERDEESSVGSYRRPPLGDNSTVTRTDISRVRAGDAPFSPDDPRRTRRPAESVVDSDITTPSRVHPARSERTDISRTDSAVTGSPRPARLVKRSRLRPRRSDSFSTVASDDLDDRATADRPSRGPTKRQGLAATLAGFTGITYLMNKQRERRERKEEERAEEIRRYDEEIAERANRTQRRRPGYNEEVTDDAAAAPALPTTVSQISRTRPQPGYPVDGSAVPIPTGPGPTAGSQMTEANTSRVRFHDDVLPAAAGGAAAATLIDEEKARRSQRPALTQTQYDSSASSAAGPPVAVRVKIHDDNRHVTLRRLSEAEAAAERDTRRRERRERQRQRAESTSDVVAGPAPGGYRRPVQSSAAAPIVNVPPPPPHTSSRLGSANLPPPTVYQTPAGPKVVGPPPPEPLSPPTRPPGYAGVNPSAGTGGYDTGTGTEMSAFDDNRRRRRAERAALRQRIDAGVVGRGDYT